MPRGTCDAPVAGELAMRAGANAQIVAEFPVVAVVPALPALACVRGDLVLIETCGREARLTDLLDLEGEILAGQRCRRPPREHRARFQREVVVRNVLGLECECRLQVGERLRRVLAG